jgi:hypothetical protein
MNFDEWWATLSPPERRVVGENNARFVWKEAVGVCAKVAESYEPRCESCPSGIANAIRAKGR